MFVLKGSTTGKKLGQAETLRLAIDEALAIISIVNCYDEYVIIELDHEKKAEVRRPYPGGIVKYPRYAHGHCGMPFSQEESEKLADVLNHCCNQVAQSVTTYYVLYLKGVTGGASCLAVINADI